MAGLDFRFERHVRIPVGDDGPYGALDLFARALGYYLGKHCDRDGHVPVRPGGGPVEGLVRRIGGDHHDRRMIRSAAVVGLEVGIFAPHDTSVRVVHFPEWQTTRDTWRLLYVRELGSFARLPARDRILAAYLLKLADASGVIACGDATAAALAHYLGRITGSSRREVRGFVSSVENLANDRYLVTDLDGWRIRNLPRALSAHNRDARPRDDHETAGRRPRDDHETAGRRPRDDHETAGRRPRDDHETAGRRPRDDHETTMSSGVTTGKHSAQVSASVPSHAVSSLPSHAVDDPGGSSAAAAAGGGEAQERSEEDARTASGERADNAPDAVSRPTAPGSTDDQGASTGEQLGFGWVPKGARTKGARAVHATLDTGKKLERLLRADPTIGELLPRPGPLADRLVMMCHEAGEPGLEHELLVVVGQCLAVLTNTEVAEPHKRIVSWVAQALKNRKADRLARNGQTLVVGTIQTRNPDTRNPFANARANRANRQDVPGPARVAR